VLWFDCVTVMDRLPTEVKLRLAFDVYVGVGGGVMVTVVVIVTKSECDLVRE